MAFVVQVACGALAGLLSHWCWFLHGEHDTSAGIYVRIYPLLVLSSVTLCNQVLQLSLLYSVFTTLSIAVSYLTALFFSIVVYRLCLSPLRRFPGPPGLKISKIYHFWKNQNFDNYRYLDTLHQQYGDVVRTGPNEVTCFTAEAFEKVYGPNSQCIRSVYYEAIKPVVSMVNTKDVELHKTWRKVWDQALSQKSLDTYEPIVYFYTQRLVKWLDAADGKPLEISSCFEKYAFDVMGRVGLGLDFNLLDGEPSRVYTMYQAGAKILGWIIPIPWFVSATSWIPGLHKNRIEKQNWIWSELKNRRESVTAPSKSNVMDHLIEQAEAQGGIDQMKNQLLGEWLVVMAAGIDPMVKCLSDMMWYLAEDKKHVDKIRAELDSLDSLNDHRQLSQLPHFNSVIHETFRLNPAIPSSGSRQVPSEGLEIGGIVIPGDTTIIVPQHTLFRRPDCFVRPTDFLPERWTTNPELVLDKSAYQPWSSGRYQCVGKHLGLMEIRIAAAFVISTFDISFAKGYDKNEVFDKMADHFVSMPGPLHMVLNRRNNI